MSDERDAWAILGGVEGLGPASLVGLVEAAGSASAALEAAERGDASTVLSLLGPVWRGRPDALPQVAAALVGAARGREARLARLEALGIGVLTLDDPAYPARLRATESPPAVLFIRGDPLALGAPRAVAVVGTRRPSDAGRRAAGRIAGALARAGAVVVSGLAVGIDGAAHAAAIAEAAPTVAVLGGGHGRLFPRAHARLADAVADEGGAVVAEVGPDVEPTRWSFPRRNRIISGLSEAVVVVEAARRSGALITAAHALEQGRECFVVPSSIESPTAAGCLALLREAPGAARIVVGIEELLVDLALDPAGGAALELPAGSWPELGRVEREVARALIEGATSLDRIAEVVAEPVATLLGALTSLELRGLVTSAYGRYRPSGRLASRGLDGDGEGGGSSGSSSGRRRRAPRSPPRNARSPTTGAILPPSLRREAHCESSSRRSSPCRSSRPRICRGRSVAPPPRP